MARILEQFFTSVSRRGRRVWNHQKICRKGKKTDGGPLLWGRVRRPDLLFGEKEDHRRRRLSHRTESQVPSDWKSCTSTTSSTVATTMMRYLYL